MMVSTNQLSATASGQVFPQPCSGDSGSLEELEK
jgi:hypothetical protein